MMSVQRVTTRRTRAATRIALSHYIANGLTCALGLLVISVGVHLTLGALAGAAAGVGAIVASPCDQVAPRRGKFWQMLPAPLFGLPLFYAVQRLHTSPLELGLLLVPATFVAFLSMAWGKRGGPIAIALMFSMIFSMATRSPDDSAQALRTTLHFGLGAGLYVIWAMLFNQLLNARYRVQMLADTLLAMAALMRTQARQFAPVGVPDDEPPSLIGQLLREQAALGDKLQGTRDIVLESPRTSRRQRLAGMLVAVLEMRDQLLACELDLDALKSHSGHAPVFIEVRRVLAEMAAEMEALADALLIGRRPAPSVDRQSRLAALHLPDASAAGPEPDTGTDVGLAPSVAMLARALASRVRHINDEAIRLAALARGEQEPDLAVVRANWQMFVSPTAWSWRPFLGVWRWQAAPLRHAIRAALAIATGYTASQALPWGGAHDYWVLLTIVVVLRGSVSQTLERRNARVAGTMLGCLLAVALFSAHPAALALFATLAVAQALAHGFAIRRYLVTAVAATVLGLVQAHMLNPEVSEIFALFERLADTLLGATIAWGFSYVLPSWERRQIPALVKRTLTAQARHAQVALALGQLHAVDNTPELEWRLARREAYDSLAALVQATQRSLSEPRAVRPPLELLERLQVHSYQLLAQLSAIKSLLLLRRGHLKLEQVGQSLAQASARLATTLDLKVPQPVPTNDAPAAQSPGPLPLPDPFTTDVTPWLLRRLDLSADIAIQLRADAEHILRSSAVVPTAASFGVGS